MAVLRETSPFGVPLGYDWILMYFGSKKKLNKGVGRIESGMDCVDA